MSHIYDMLGMWDVYDTSLRFAYEVLSAAEAACHASGISTFKIQPPTFKNSIEEARRTKCK